MCSMELRKPNTAFGERDAYLPSDLNNRRGRHPGTRGRPFNVGRQPGNSLITHAMARAHRKAGHAP